MSEIMHWGIMKFGTKYYICNQAVKASEDKITDYHSKVTCKNCLKILKGEVNYNPRQG